MQMLFQNLGLDEKETRTFLKMLELGAQPVSVIAKHLGVPRSSMYVILERLKKLQLIDEFERSGVIYVKCIPVKQIGDVLRAKELSINQTMKMLNEEMSHLESLENKLSVTPVVRFYEGKQGVMKMYEEVIRENSFVAFFNPATVHAIMPEYYFKVGDMLKKNKGKAKELLVPSAEAERYKKRFDSPLHQIKMLSKGAPFHADTLVCEKTIYMISYGDNQISGTGITNPNLAQSQKVIFEELWSKI